MTIDDEIKSAIAIIDKSVKEINDAIETLQEEQYAVRIQHSRFDPMKIDYKIWRKIAESQNGKSSLLNFGKNGQFWQGVSASDSSNNSDNLENSEE